MRSSNSRGESTTSSFYNYHQIDERASLGIKWVKSATHHLYLTWWILKIWFWLCFWASWESLLSWVLSSSLFRSIGSWSFSSTSCFLWRPPNYEFSNDIYILKPSWAGVVSWLLLESSLSMDIIFSGTWIHMQAPIVQVQLSSSLMLYQLDYRVDCTLMLEPQLVVHWMRIMECVIWIGICCYFLKKYVKKFSVIIIESKDRDYEYPWIV